MQWTWMHANLLGCTVSYQWSVYKSQSVLKYDATKEKPHNSSRNTVLDISNHRT